MQVETSPTEPNSEAHYFYGKCKQHYKLSSEQASQMISSLYANTAALPRGPMQALALGHFYNTERTEVSNIKVTFLRLLSQKLLKTLQRRKECWVLLDDAKANSGMQFFCLLQRYMLAFLVPVLGYCLS